jgi:hypothetical protein
MYLNDVATPQSVADSAQPAAVLATSRFVSKAAELGVAGVWQLLVPIVREVERVRIVTRDDLSALHIDPAQTVQPSRQIAHSAVWRLIWGSGKLFAFKQPR